MGFSSALAFNSTSKVPFYFVNCLLGEIANVGHLRSRVHSLTIIAFMLAPASA